ncbi:MAG: Do family serine endopeptidase [Phycisphaerae bacterium]|nr:Do family serine endopeptidase [Phycisphaerae bacterium]
MCTKTSRRWQVISGVLLIGMIGGISLVTWQSTARADNQAQIAGPTEQEIAGVEAISSVFRKVAAKVTPAVVQIHAKSGMPKPAKKDKDEAEGKKPEKGPDLENLPEPFRQFFKEYGKDGSEQLPDELRRFYKKYPHGMKEIPRMGMGSGFIFDAKNGYVLTNNHVIEGAEPENVSVFTADKREFAVDWIRTDPKTEVAVVKLKSPENLTEIKFGDSSKVQVGDWVLAVGSPFHSRLAKTVTFGIVSAKGRDLDLAIDYQDFIQTDAAINPGNSGGPLVNLRGEVIGINTAIASPVSSFSSGAQNAGIGFALPANLAKWVTTQLIEHKEVVRGYLGVVIQSLDDQPGLAKTYGLDSSKGVVVSGVGEGTPAAKAGLKLDDVVLSINGQDVSDNRQLSNRVAMLRPGTKATFKIWRDRKPMDVEVTIGMQPKGFSTRGKLRDMQMEDQEPEAGKIETLGVTVAPLTEANGKKYGWKGDEGGLLITGIDPEGEAAEFRLRQGDLILKVQGNEIKTIEELRKLTDKKALAEGVRMYVKSQATGGGTNLFLKNR